LFLVIGCKGKKLIWVYGAFFSKLIIGASKYIHISIYQPVAKLHTFLKTRNFFIAVLLLVVIFVFIFSK